MQVQRIYRRVGMAAARSRSRGCCRRRQRGRGALPTGHGAGDGRRATDAGMWRMGRVLVGRVRWGRLSSLEPLPTIMKLQILRLLSTSLLSTSRRHHHQLSSIIITIAVNASPPINHHHHRQRRLYQICSSVLVQRIDWREYMGRNESHTNVSTTALGAARAAAI